MDISRFEKKLFIYIYIYLHIILQCWSSNSLQDTIPLNLGQLRHFDLLWEHRTEYIFFSARFVLYSLSSDVLQELDE